MDIENRKLHMIWGEAFIPIAFGKGKLPRSKIFTTSFGIQQQKNDFTALAGMPSLPPNPVLRNIRQGRRD